MTRHWQDSNHRREYVPNSQNNFSYCLAPLRFANAIRFPNKFAVADEEVQMSNINDMDHCVGKYDGSIVSSSYPSAYGFLEPGKVFRATRLNPAFELGRTTAYLTEPIVWPASFEHSEWRQQYIHMPGAKDITSTVSWIGTCYEAELDIRRQRKSTRGNSRGTREPSC